MQALIILAPVVLMAVPSLIATVRNHTRYESIVSAAA